MTEGVPALRAERIAVARGDEIVLRGVGLDLVLGRTTVVMGASGAGKTSLVRALAGLDEPVEGRVEEWACGRYRPVRVGEVEGLGVLLGGTTSFSAWTHASLTVRQQLDQALEPQMLTSAERLARVTAIADDLGLTRWLDAPTPSLAAHHRRRAALATALVGRPRIILLDEIETALDSTSVEQVLSAVRGARSRTGAAVLVTTHDLRIARALGDELLVLGGGRVVVRGPVDDLLAGVTDGESFLEGHLRAAAELTRPDPPKPRQWTLRFDPFVLACFVVAAAVILLVALAARQGF
ncbi:Methionine import ATP-binding protein MetN [Pseudonocardia autotrophica]|nr:Methionine import ATP-binding protein MetN [Pseudonocardia autotrophica]